MSTLVQDIVERAIRTAVALALGWLSTQLNINLVGNDKLSGALVAVLTTVALGLVGKLFGDPKTASFLHGVESAGGYKLEWPTPQTFRVLNADDELVVEGDLSGVIDDHDVDEDEH